MSLHPSKYPGYREYLKARTGKFPPRQPTWKEAASKVARRWAFSIIGKIIRFVFPGWSYEISIELKDKDVLICGHYTHASQTAKSSVTHDDINQGALNPY